MDRRQGEAYRKERSVKKLFVTRMMLVDERERREMKSECCEEAEQGLSKCDRWENVKSIDQSVVFYSRRRDLSTNFFRRREFVEALWSYELYERHIFFLVRPVRLCMR